MEIFIKPLTFITMFTVLYFVLKIMDMLDNE